MKHLKKWNLLNESSILDNKEPIDVQSDIIDFKEKMSVKYTRYLKKKSLDEFISKLDSIISNNPTLTDDWDIYKIYECDDYGRVSRTLMYVKAISRDHARIKASMILKNIEIVLTGFYGAEKLSESNYNNLVKSTEKKLNDLKNPI